MCYETTLLFPEFSCLASVIDGWMSMWYGWNDAREGKTEVPEGQPIQVPLHPPKFPIELTWNRSRSSAVGVRRLTFGAITRSVDVQTSVRKGARRSAGMWLRMSCVAKTSCLRQISACLCITDSFRKRFCFSFQIRTFYHQFHSYVG
jgi:hypothetical protein